MAALGPRPIGRSRVVRLITTLGVVALLSGGALLATSVAGISSAGKAAPTLTLTSTAAGVTCNNSNPTAPVCSGLAAGDVVNVSGANFTDGSLASIEQCNSDPTQPQILFLGNDIPVSCSALALTNISSKGKLAGTKTIATGTVGPPTAGTPTCTQTVPTTSVIKGCSHLGQRRHRRRQIPVPADPDPAGLGRHLRAGHR